MKKKSLRISTIVWFFSIFNKFEKNFLVKFCIVEIDLRKYQTIFLFDSEIQDYVFVNEKIVKNICKILQIISMKLSREKHFNKFDEIKIKLVTHFILFSLTIQDYSELSTSMFITKIENHFIILDKSWINKHKIIIDEKNNFIHFKFDRCDHARLTSRFKFNKTMFSRKLWLSSSFKFKKTSSSINFQKYKILQRRKTFFVSKQTLSRSIVKNSNEKKKSQKKIIAIDVFWSLISISKLFFLTNTKKKTSLKSRKNFSSSVVSLKLLSIKILKSFWHRFRDVQSNSNVLNCFRHFRNLKMFSTMIRF